MSAFKAKYPGYCSTCDDRINAGDLVVYVDDSLVHLDCEGPALAPVRAEWVCPQCWLVMPCGCQDGL